MLLILSLISLASSCNEFCSTTCRIFNAEASCYENCECPGQSQVKDLPAFLVSAYKSFESDVFKSTQCTESSLLHCGSLSSYSDFLLCYSETGCKDLVEFKYLYENLPKDLWLVSSPKRLVSYIQDKTEMNFFLTFDLCQRDCLDQYYQSTRAGLEFFPYEDCVGLCGEQLDKDIDENCLNTCVFICPSDESFCFSNCLKKKCGIEEGRRKKRRCIGCMKNVQPVMEPAKEIRCPVDDPEFRDKFKINVID